MQLAKFIGIVCGLFFVLYVLGPRQTPCIYLLIGTITQYKDIDLVDASPNFPTCILAYPVDDNFLLFGEY